MECYLFSYIINYYFIIQNLKKRNYFILNKISQIKNITDGRNDESNDNLIMDDENIDN